MVCACIGTYLSIIVQVAAGGAGAAQGGQGAGGQQRKRAEQAGRCHLEQRLGGRAHDVHAA